MKCARVQVIDSSTTVLLLLLLNLQKQNSTKFGLCIFYIK